MPSPANVGSEPDPFEALRRIYDRADALYEGWSCPGSTECCRFGITGRQPYVTSIELFALRRAIARRGGPLGARRRALPLLAGTEDERTCPLLDRDGRCSVYDDRPFGCRTYYCERASKGAGPDRTTLRDLLHELRTLAARHTLGGEHARPLVNALRDLGL
jgi:hypothetical protein